MWILTKVKVRSADFFYSNVYLHILMETTLMVVGESGNLFLHLFLSLFY